MIGSPTSTPKALLLGAVLLAAGLAGCASSSDSGDTLQYSSYEEAKNAEGTTWEVNNTDSPIELKLLEPSSTKTSTGETDIVFLLYDSEADEPITNAQFTPQSEHDKKCAPSHSFCAEMPAMGHGTSPEESPQHAEFGVYEGMTTISMSGSWLLNVNPEVDGQILEFDIDLEGEGSGSNHDG